MIRTFSPAPLARLPGFLFVLVVIGDGSARILAKRGGFGSVSR
jgi:hypothetical protein